MDSASPDMTGTVGAQVSFAAVLCSLRGAGSRQEAQAALGGQWARAQLTSRLSQAAHTVVLLPHSHVELHLCFYFEHLGSTMENMPQPAAGWIHRTGNHRRTHSVNESQLLH